MGLFSPYEPERHGDALEQIELRLARPEDACPLADLVAEREGVAVADVLAGLRRECAGAFPRDRRRLFVALHEARVVAFGRSKRVDGRELGDPGPRRPPAGWYLSGVIVRPALRRRGIARRLTALRIEDLRGETDELLYVVNARNRASIDLHAAFGFEERTRAFDFPGHTFEGGEGVLFGLRFDRGVERSRSIEP